MALRIFAGACAGLHYAHVQTHAAGRPLNIVHRDVTPSNLLVTWEGSTPVEVSPPAGDVALTFVNPELSLRRTMTVRVPAGGRAQQSIAFKNGQIAVDVTPWADVYIGDRNLGTTPLFPRELYEGTYALRLVNSDLKAITVSRAARDQIGGLGACKSLGVVEVKGRGPMDLFCLERLAT